VINPIVSAALPETEPTDFSLVLGGPLYQRVGMAGDGSYAPRRK